MRIRIKSPDADPETPLRGLCGLAHSLVSTHICLFPITTTFTNKDACQRRGRPPWPSILEQGEGGSFFDNNDDNRLAHRSLAPQPKNCTEIKTGVCKVAESQLVDVCETRTEPLQLPHNPMWVKKICPFCVCVCVGSGSLDPLLGLPAQIPHTEHDEACQAAHPYCTRVVIKRIYHRLIQTYES